MVLIRETQPSERLKVEADLEWMLIPPRADVQMRIPGEAVVAYGRDRLASTNRIPARYRNLIDMAIQNTDAVITMKENPTGRLMCWMPGSIRTQGMVCLRDRAVERGQHNNAPAIPIFIGASVASVPTPALVESRDDTVAPQRVAKRFQFAVWMLSDEERPVEHGMNHNRINRSRSHVVAFFESENAVECLPSY